MRLHEYVNEIFDIARENEEDIGVAKDMFIANIRNSGDNTLPHYKGANVNYVALKPYYNELVESQNHYKEVTKKHYSEIVELRKKQDFVGVKKLVCDCTCEF